MSLSNFKVERVFKTHYKLPERNETVEVVAESGAIHRRQFIATDAAGIPIFYDTSTKCYHVGACNWRYVIKKCTGCAKCSPDNYYDIKPNDGCVAPSKWMDSLDHRPDLKQPVWICNGDGGVVAPATYMGSRSGYCHGLQLHGTLPGLRDDHYFWQPRRLVTPPATRVFVKPPPIVGGWISVQEQSPTNGQRVWAAEANGTVFLSIYYDAMQKGAPGFYTYEDNGTHDCTAYWMPLESHKPTFPIV